MRRLIFFMFVALALAQNDPVFRATTQLVRIDVVAQDKNGDLVTYLTKDDFELKVSGKPQSIDTFTVTSAEPAPPETLPRGTFSNKHAAVEVTQGRYTVFLLDRRNTNFQLQSFANQQFLKMLSATPLSGKVALYILNDSGFQIGQEFTSDRELIKTKAAGLWGEIPAPVYTLDQAEASANETIHAFQDIAKHLAGISGQKVLVWVSTGFPDNTPPPPPNPGAKPATVVSSYAPPTTSFLQDIDKAVRILGNANIVVESAESKYLGATALPGVGPTTSYANTLQMIAERTGGRFFPGDDTNDFASTLLAAANDRATSYELGYYAGNNLRPGLQPFDIHCKRPGITLRYREGYYIDKKPPALPTDTRTVDLDILEGAVDAVSIPLTAKAVRTAGNVSNIMLRVNVDAHPLTFRQEDGVWKTKISTLARFASAVEDQLGDVPLDSPALNLTAEQHDRALREGINLRFTMRIPAEAATLRVLVRDDDSGNTGTVTIPLDDLPEF